MHDLVLDVLIGVLILWIAGGGFWLANKLSAINEKLGRIESKTIKRIESMTKEEYDALAVKDEETIYICDK